MAWGYRYFGFILFIHETYKTLGATSNFRRENRKNKKFQHEGSTNVESHGEKFSRRGDAMTRCPRFVGG